MKRWIIAGALILGVSPVFAQQAALPFKPSATGARGTPLSVTTSDSSGTLPSGPSVVVSNAGTTNPMYCNVNGVAATASDQPILAGSFFNFGIPTGVTTLHCIATGGTTTANMVGGIGTATGAGGGTGSGGGGGGGTSSSFGSAFPSTGTAVGFTDGTNMVSGLAKTGNAAAITDRAVVVADPNVLAAVQAPIPGGANVIGYTSTDPCAQQNVAKANVAISMQNTTTVKLVALASAKKIYVCSLSLIASGATVFSIADGTKVSTECDTAAEAVIGAAVASHGLSLAANGGISYGNGTGTVAFTTTAAHDLCLFQSGSVDLSGNLTYVQQ